MGTQGQVADDGLARRLKALACTAPLHDLDHRKTRLDWAQAEVYQMAEIAFQLIDQVTVAMDFDRGAGHRDVVSRVVPFVAAQAPDRDRVEHERVAQWVLDGLINVGSIDRGFTAVYGALGQDGYRRRSFDFKLLVELASPDGEVYLRASDEAINVLVGALDTDVESAQIAAEIKLENLIRRGRLSDAQVAAEQARYRTVQYAEQLRRKLEATRRDVRQVDWEREIPDLIEHALDHVADRYRVENAILGNITQARDESDDPEHKRRAAQLVDVVRDCIGRHTQLQARLMEAGRTFRSEQDRQQFSGPARTPTVDLFGQLLVPTLSLPLVDAAVPAAVFFRAGTGAAEVVAPRIADLVQLLLTPSVERDDLTGRGSGAGPGPAAGLAGVHRRAVARRRRAADRARRGTTPVRAAGAGPAGRSGAARPGGVAGGARGLAGGRHRPPPRRPAAAAGGRRRVPPVRPGVRRCGPAGGQRQDRGREWLTR